MGSRNCCTELRRFYKVWSRVLPHVSFDIEEDEDEGTYLTMVAGPCTLIIGATDRDFDGILRVPERDVLELANFNTEIEYRKVSRDLSTVLMYLRIQYETEFDL